MLLKKKVYFKTFVLFRSCSACLTYFSVPVSAFFILTESFGVDSQYFICAQAHTHTHLNFLALLPSGNYEFNLIEDHSITSRNYNIISQMGMFSVVNYFFFIFQDINRIIIIIVIFQVAKVYHLSQDLSDENWPQTKDRSGRCVCV